MDYATVPPWTQEQFTKINANEAIAPPGWRWVGGAGTIVASALVELGSRASDFSAMINPTGVTLRLLGPLVEILCLLGLQRWGGQGLTLGGVRVETFLYGGLVFGFAMVVLGLTWFRSSRRPVAEDGDRA